MIRTEKGLKETDDISWAVGEFFFSVFHFYFTKSNFWRPLSGVRHVTTSFSLASAEWDILFSLKLELASAEQKKKNKT